MWKRFIDVANKRGRATYKHSLAFGVENAKLFLQKLPQLSC
jgi:hypothetical protein